MAWLQTHRSGTVLAACLVAAAGLSLLLSPPGLVALSIAALFLWPWDGAIGSRLDSLGLDRQARSISGCGILLGAAAANLVLGGQLDGHLMYRGDFQTYYVGAQVGLHYGWAHIFDPGMQRPFWTAAFADRAPFIPYLNTPPQAWLVAPLALLPYPVAFAAWVVLMLAAAAATVLLVAPSGGGGHAIYLLVAGSLWVLAYSLAGGQNAIIGALAIALCWRLAVAGRPGWAGVALALIALRPNATFLVPVGLLVAGHRRLFITWLLASAVIGAVVLVSLGPSGVRQFLDLGAEIRRTHPGAVTMTVSHVVGGGAVGVIVGLALAATALLVARRAGRSRTDLAIAAGVLASVFVTPYIHIQDYLTLVAAGAILARSAPRASLGFVLAALLLAAPPGAIFGVAWPAVLLAVEASWLAWLVVETQSPAIAPELRP